MTEIRIGTFDSGGHDFVELRRLPPLSAAKTLRQSGGCFTVRAHRAVTDPPHRRGAPAGHFIDSPAVRRAWKKTCEVATALDASTIVLMTPPSFRPTDGHIDQLVAFMQWAHRSGTQLAWSPRGAGWTNDILWPLCRELSLTHVTDPMERDTARGRPPYFHIVRPLDLDQVRDLIARCRASIDRWNPPASCACADPETATRLAELVANAMSSDEPSRFDPTPGEP